MKIASTTAFFAAALFVLQLSGSPAHAIGAKAPCKGLDETACSGDASCSWVKPGKIRKGYCRAKPAPKASAPKTAPKAGSAGSGQ